VFTYSIYNEKSIESLKKSLIKLLEN